MSNLDKLSIKAFTEELGSDSPAPGGGSAAALSGALSCSLISMVAKLALKRSKEPGKNIKLKKIIDSSENSSQQFIKLITNDTEAFNEIINSFRLPKDTDSDKQARREAIQAATRHASEVPLSTARLGLEALNWVKDLTDLGDDNTISDLGVAGLMAYTAVKGAVWNVKINIGSIRDSGFVQETNFELERILGSLNNLWPEIQRIVEEKIIK